MKTLYCLLITTLLTVTSYGAEKTIFSPNGLEGFGDDGIGVHIQPLDEKHRRDKSEIKAFLDQIELQLLKAGLKVKEGSDEYITVNVFPVVVEGKTVYLGGLLYADRPIEFTTSGGKKYNGRGTVFVFGGGTG